MNETSEDDTDEDQPRPSTSKGKRASMSPEEKAEKLIREAELVKGDMFAMTGKQEKFDQVNKTEQFRTDFVRDMIHSVLVDEEYSAIGSHLDESVIKKIKRGEYVDFSKLLVKDRSATIDDESKLQPVYKDGQVFWQSLSDQTSMSSISNFHKWEQAFRIYSKIYVKFHPHRASELIQYSHNIHSASLTFIWDNVYNYDHEFRLHIARHPMRSWAVTLQHAWNLKMRDRLGQNSIGNHSGSSFGQSRQMDRGDHNNSRMKQSEPCKRYNHGKYNFGSSCKYEHKCSYCFKFGHGILECRRLGSDRDNHFSKRENHDLVRISPEGKGKPSYSQGK